MDCQKHLFSLPDNHHYINCSYLAPLPKTVEEAGIRGIRQKNRPWETVPKDFFTDSNRLRALFAQLINAKRSADIAIIPSVSYGLATAAQNIDSAKGDTVIIAGEQFPSNVYAWKRFCNEHNYKLQIIEAPTLSEGRGQQWNEQILEAIDSNTLLVALGNVHWTDGTLFEIVEIGKRIRENDGYFVIDGTQSVGALPFDVQEVRPDALICAGYKWLMGPYSMALGYFSPRLQDGQPLEEGWIVRKGSEDFSGLIDYKEAYQPGAKRFDVGERSNFILVPMMIEALKLILEWNPKNIQQYCEKLTTDFIQELKTFGYQVEDPAWRGHHMFGIRLPKQIDMDDLNNRLSNGNIHLSLRGSSLRISPNVYNEKKDIDALLKVLTDVGE